MQVLLSTLQVTLQDIDIVVHDLVSINIVHLCHTTLILILITYELLLL